MVDINDVTAAPAQAERATKPQNQTPKTAETGPQLAERATKQTDVVELSAEAQSRAQSARSPRETSLVQQDVSGRTPARTAADTIPQQPAGPTAARADYQGTAAIVDNVTVAQQRAVSVDITVGGPDINPAFTDTGIVEKPVVPEAQEIIGGSQQAAAAAQEVMQANQESRVTEDTKADLQAYAEATSQNAQPPVAEPPAATTLAPAPGVTPAVTTYEAVAVPVQGSEAATFQAETTAATEQAIEEEVSEANTEAVEQASTEALRAYEGVQRAQSGGAANRGGPSGFTGGVAVNLTV
jgi:hypothetical protein